MKIDNENIILLHPGKTGGTSIEHTFKEQYLKVSHLDSRNGSRDIMFGLDPEYRIYLQHADIRFYNLLNIPLYNYKVYTTVRRRMNEFCRVTTITVRVQNIASMNS